MDLITLGKVWKATKTIAENQYQLRSRCNHAVFHVWSDDIKDSSFHYLGMSGNSAVGSMNEHEVHQKYEIELLWTIGVHDMKSFDPFYTIPRSQPCEWYQCLVGEENDIAVSVDERGPGFVLFRIRRRDQ